ncbi:MAG: DUF4105 domain-containing protein [Elusimicrobiales bacterium]|nr:DUF4105 domain-containing protein [Elusimicrobiales bacterium]
MLAIPPEQELRRLALRQTAAKAEAWQDKYWLRLVYYEKRFFGGYKSHSVNPNFYLSKWGNISPRLELEAAIDGLFFEGNDDESPECRFPERYLWLREKLGLQSSEFSRRCEAFNEWKASLDTESVSLLFAAGYLNNPSTLYGHTFLRLHKRGGAGADLLDYTVNYAATADADSGLFFALKGLAGAYPGQFSTIPYYLKIQEYHNLENRDLWGFPLYLKPHEIDRLMRHCWELGKAAFPYYFFTRNCSWQLMPLLDIVKPELKLSGRFRFWVIPSDTAKAVLAGTLPGVPDWRPSLWKTVEWKRAQLTEGERALVLELARGDQQAQLKRLEGLPPGVQAAVLETAADYLSWRFYAGRISKDELDKRTDPLLAVRAPLGEQATFTGGPQRPANIKQAHESLRVGAGVTALKNGTAYDLSLRYALQDLLDDPAGYLPDAALEMGAFKLRYEERYNRFYMKEARLVRVVSMNPWDSWVRRQSWELGAGVEQADETGRQPGSSAIWTMNAGSGVSAEWRGPVRQLWYLLAQADGGLGGALESRWRAGPGVKGGVLLEKGALRANFEARYIAYTFGDTDPLWAGTAAASLKLSKDSALRAEYSWRGGVKEAGLYYNAFVFPP